MIDWIGALRKLLTDVGNNSDDHNGLTLFGRHKQMIDHVHSEQKVYPTQADGIALATHANDWVLGTIVEIVPVDTITSQFDIHEVLVEDVNTKDKTYELVLYYGADDIECCRWRFASTTNKGGIPAQFGMTILIPANSRIRGQLAIEDGGSKTANISLRYHEY